MEATPENWTNAADAACLAASPAARAPSSPASPAGQKKRDRYGRKPVLVRSSEDPTWRRFASCKDALRATPGLTSYVLSALVNGRAAPATSGAEFEAKFVGEDDAEQPSKANPAAADAEAADASSLARFLPAGRAVLLPTAPAGSAAPPPCPATMRPGELLGVDGRVFYARRPGEDFQAVVDALCGAAPPSSKPGEAPRVGAQADTVRGTKPRPSRTLQNGYMCHFTVAVSVRGSPGMLYRSALPCAAMK